MRAARSGALDIVISPWYGEYNSRIKRTAPDTDNADTNKVVTAVPFAGGEKAKADEEGREPGKQDYEHRHG